MRILKKIAVILLGGALSIASLAAQNRTVSGTVLDSSQQPVIGAAVMLQGTTVGNTTDVDGKFSLDVPDGDALLLVSCLGYVEQNVNVPANTNSVTVILQEDNLMLEETVVVGYGVQKKVNLTGSIAVVGSEDLENRINHSVTNMLQGAAAGVNVTTSSGKPGSFLWSLSTVWPVTPVTSTGLILMMWRPSPSSRMPRPPQSTELVPHSV